MNREEFKQVTQQKKLILDGATGSVMMAAGMPRGICTEQWILEHPEILLDLQTRYVEAGSQVVYAPTFAANRISLANHGLENQVNELNHRLVALSKTAAAGRALVAGDLTTTGNMEADYSELFDVYTEQISALADAGADLLVAETLIGTDEAMAVIDAAHAVCDLPVMCSMTMQADGSLFFGGNIFETAPVLEELGADAVGINCSTGPEQLESIVKNVSESVSVPMIAKPNAGMPFINDRGIAEYTMTPEFFAESMKRLSDLGAGILGGCCGTTPEHIAAMTRLLEL